MTAIHTRDYSSPYQAAYRHLKEINVYKPEIWMSMSSVKISWTSSRAKEYCPPSSNQVLENTMHHKYLKRTKDAEDLSFLQWLCNYQHTIVNPNAARMHFKKLGHRDHYIYNLLSRIQSLHRYS